MREVDKADVYVGLFGWGYGSEDEEGVSPTEREFDRASELGVKRLVFVKGRGDAGRHPKMQALIRRAQTDLVRRRFDSTMELQMALYASLLDFWRIATRSTAVGSTRLLAKGRQSGLSTTSGWFSSFARRDGSGGLP